MPLIQMRWNGHSAEPVGASVRWCHDNLGSGMIHMFEPIFPRDPKLNKAKFALLNEAYKQLPHDADGMFRNFDHFRKWLMVAEGFCKTTDLAFANEREAQQRLPFLKGTFEDNPRDKDFAIVQPIGAGVIRVYEPKSLSDRSMPISEFKDVMNKITERACNMIGISVDELKANAGKAA